MPSMSDSDPAMITGRYSDGASAAVRNVVVVPVLGGLSLRDRDEDREIARWPRDRILLLDDLGDGGARFGLANARLTIDDPNSAAALRAAVPEIFAATPPERRPSAGLLLVAIAAIGGLIGTYFALPMVSDALAPLVPHAWYDKVGATAVNQIATVFGRGEDGYCHGEKGNAALRDLMARLAATTETPTPVTVRVIDGGMVNAFAAPGGHLVVMRGLIEYVEAPSELVGVLAHEYAHALGGDPESGLFHAVIGSVLTRVALGGSGDVTSQLGFVGGTLLDLSHSRDVEAAADAQALEMLSAAGIRTDGLALFFERLEGESEDENIDLPGFLSSHPKSAARAEASKAARGGQDRGLSKAQWDAVLAMCAS